MDRSPRRLNLAAMILAAIAGTSLGCDGSISTEPDDREVPFQTVYRSQLSESRSELREVVESTGSWGALWDEIAGGPRPDVDFTRDMVILYGAGEQPNGCYEVEIRDIERRRGVIEVEVDLLVPGTGCVCTPVTTRPVHAVRTPRLSGPVDFDVERVTIRCT
ncbi:MAG TPA: protease complex subunit PrcB family protein [Thermoanaerobaculia bacterium]|nr:protease complex subunit PrcB family protein [Thermoanaerobaculia bacterium]